MTAFLAFSLAAAAADERASRNIFYTVQLISPTPTFTAICTIIVQLNRTISLVNHPMRCASDWIHSFFTSLGCLAVPSRIAFCS